MPQLAAIIVLASLLAYYGNQLPDRLWSAYLPILLFFCLFQRAWRGLLVLVAAYLWAAALLHQDLDHRLAGSHDNSIGLVRGLVADLPGIETGRIRLLLKIDEIEGYTASLPRLMRLNWYQDEIVPRAGERWQFEVKLRQPRGLSNPDAFDFAAWQFSQGIDASGYIRHSRLNLKLQPAHAGQVAYWRTRLASSIDDYCGDCRQRGLIKALALGYRADIGERALRLLRDSGTAHLLAISGMHIGLVALFGFALGRLCWHAGLRPAGLNRLHTAAWVAMPAAVVYAALAGFSLPTVRALVMLSILVAGLLQRQRINLLQSLSLTVVCILLIDPRAVGSSSFWLSVGALLVIGVARLRMPRGLPWWQQLLLLQCFFSVLFAPLGALVFDQLNPASWPANIIAIPLISFVVLPMVLLACLLSPAGPQLAGPLLKLADLLLQLMLDYLQWLLSLGLEPVPSAYPRMLLLILLLLAGWLLLPRGLGTRIAAATGICLLMGWQPQRPPQGEFELIVFDVGMGTSVLLRTRHHSLVYDFGPGREGVYSASEWGLLPAMRKRALERPDLAVVSHVDQDHSGGLYRLLRSYPELPLLSGTPRKLRERFGLPRSPPSCHDYPAWQWDGVEFEFLPGAATWDGTNNRSCVLLVKASQRVLLPGDIERGREQQLVEDYPQLLQADVLLVPHHGSDTSSSSGFVQQVSPLYAVVTLSRNNRWGFPSAAVTAAYAGAGVKLYRSDQDGAVSFASSPEALAVKVDNAVKKRIWRRW